MENTQRKVCDVELISLTVHVDVLAEFYQLHFSWHVTHGPHQVAEVFAGYETVLVFVELYKSFTQLWRHKHTQKRDLDV